MFLSGSALRPPKGDPQGHRGRPARRPEGGPRATDDGVPANTDITCLLDPSWCPLFGPWPQLRYWKSRGPNEGCRAVTPCHLFTRRSHDFQSDEIDWPIPWSASRNTGAVSHRRRNQWAPFPRGLNEPVVRAAQQPRRGLRGGMLRCACMVTGLGITWQRGVPRRTVRAARKHERADANGSSYPPH